MKIEVYEPVSDPGKLHHGYKMMITEAAVLIHMNKNLHVAWNCGVCI